MASLAELAEDYRMAAVRLRVGLRAYRARLDTEEETERAAIIAEMKMIEDMLREVREVGDLARHYYEPGYCRDRRYTV